MKTLILTFGFWILFIPLFAQTNGNINLVSPENDSQLVLGGSRIFEWDAPDNLVVDQKYVYHFKIVKMNEMDNTDEIINNEAYVEYVTDSLSSTSGSSVNMDTVYFATAQYFAWQVKAYTADTLFAQSDVHTFEGPLWCNVFKAGNRPIYPTKFTYAPSSDSLCGWGYTMIGSKKVDVKFDTIEIHRSGAELFMGSGVLNGSYKDTLNLSHYDLPSVCNTTLYVDSLLIYAGGSEKVKCNFNLLQKFNNDTININIDNWVKHSQGNYIIGSVNFCDTIKLGNLVFELTEPSDVLIKNTRYRPYYNGYVKYIYNEDTIKVNIPTDSNELDYINSNTEGSVSDEILSIYTSSCVFDFNNERSPGIFQDTIEWQGIYFNNFGFNEIEKEDVYSILVANNPIPTSENVNTKWLGYISDNNLVIDVDTIFENPTEGAYNYFDAHYDTIKIDNIGDTLIWKVTGDIYVPYLKDSPFKFNIPCIHDELLLAENDTSSGFEIFPLSEFALYEFGVIIDNEKYLGEIDSESSIIKVVIPDFDGDKYFTPFFDIAGHQFIFNGQSWVSETGEHYILENYTYPIKVVSYDNRILYYDFEFEIEQSTEIHGVVQSEAIMLYPNPVGDYLKVSGLGKGNLISIIDLKGEIVYTATADNSVERINTEKMIEGIYVIKIVKDGQVINKKIIKR